MLTVKLLVALGILIFSFVAGGLLGRRLRMPDHGWKIALILFTILAAGAILGFEWPPPLGIDLKGGVIMVYEVDQTKKQPGQKVDMDKLIEAINKRVNPGGTREVSIRPYGEEQIEVIIPRAEDEAELQRVKTKISSAGTLEFRILCNNVDDEPLIERAKQNPGLTDTEKKRLAWWVPVEKGQESDFAVKGWEEREYGEGSGGTLWRTFTDARGKKTLQVLVRQDPYDVEGGYLTNASQGYDRRGRPCVEFAFNATGARLFGELTGRNIPEDAVTRFRRRLGIILSGSLYSAPNIESTIYDRGEITGNFSKRDVDDLVAVLNAGALPAALVPQPISELRTGPTLGQDTMQKGAMAMIASTLLVFGFMLVYYRFSGMVACAAVIVNLAATLALMIAIHAELSLPGIAGLVLTVGMAVDGNVLIYERLREEIDHGATLRMAIRNAFARATTTIVDSNLTTLITAFVLYYIGTDQVKGFAVTLGLGVALSMYTAVFCSRAVFDIAEKHGWITKLKMMRLLTRTNVDFLSIRKFAISGTVGVILIGLAATAMRGRGLLDIDFTGGVSVEMVFKKAHDIGAVRNTLELPDLAVAVVQYSDEETGKRFMINTSQQAPVDPETGKPPINPQTGEPYTSIEWVQDYIKKTYKDELAVNSLSVASIASIPGRVPKAPVEKPKAAKPETAEPPAEKTEPPKPPGEKTGPAKPPAEKTEPAKPPAEKTEPPKPPAEKTEPAKPPEEKPAAEKQGRSDLPPESMLASADPGAVFLALGAPAEEKPAAEGEPAKPPAEKTEPPKPPGEKTEAAKPPTEKIETPKPPAEKPKPTAEEPGGLADPFAGGTKATLEFAYRVSYAAVEDLLKEALGKNEPPYEISNSEYQPGASSGFTTWDVKLALPEEPARVVFEKISQKLSDSPFFPSANAIGGRVAGGARTAALAAIVASCVLIILYLWVRFQHLVYGLAAIIALVHDVLLTLGAVAISYWLAKIFIFQWLLVDEFKIGLPVLAAFLTIIGYSINDTIIVFDRIREVRGKLPRVSYKIVNDSVNQTLSRTLITSGTTLVAIVVLYVGGGQQIHGFAFTLLIGVLTGTYSSIYIASPWLLLVSRQKVSKGDEHAAQ